MKCFNMRLLYVTSEVFPLAKTGGLADVSAALPAALGEFGIDVRLLMPGYPQAIDRALNSRTIARLGDILGCGEVQLIAGRLPDSDVPVWLVDCPALYDRAGGIYQNEDGNDWPDNARRFALLNHVGAVIALAGGPDRWRPDIVHSHDWHAGLLPLLLAPAKPRPATVLTIHNLAYQGVFDGTGLEMLGLVDDPQVASTVEFYGRLSFLKAGIGCADALTTVSPTYAREILTAEYGCGLDGMLRERADRLMGIMNGVDYRVWGPAVDSHIVANYTPQRLSGKRACKAAIQEELGLEVGSEIPLVAFTSRLAHQKMPDIVLEALPALLAQGIQFALVAEGDADYAGRFHELAASHPGRVAVRAYQEPLAHRLLAGADILLHPSRYEPCGLAPIYAMRYGTVPVVRRSGGMADSVVGAEQKTIQSGTATGFSFENPTTGDLIDCVQRALACYRQPIAWRRIQSRAMRQDFGWRRSAQAYAELYRTLAVAPSEMEAEDELLPAKLIA